MRGRLYALEVYRDPDAARGRLHRLSVHTEAQAPSGDGRGRLFRLEVTVPYVEDAKGRVYQLWASAPDTQVAAGRLYQILVTTAVSAAPVPLQYVADDGSLRPINIGVWTGTAVEFVR